MRPTGVFIYIDFVGDFFQHALDYESLRLVLTAAKHKVYVYGHGVVDQLTPKRGAKAGNSLEPFLESQQLQVY